MIAFTDGAGRLYEWGGGFGDILRSRERAVPVGSLRVIRGIIFFAYMHSGQTIWFGSPTVHWTVPDVTVERIREIKRLCFGDLGPA